jgi:steroid delta-isomerase-like uncharacterized protein
MTNNDVITACMQLVKEHIRAENAHQIAAIMATFGSQPRFVLNGMDIDGREDIRSLYESFGFSDAGGFSDLHVAVTTQHMSDAAMILEVILSGRHTAAWQGIPATGKFFEIPACAVFTFDAEGKLAGERVYFDGSLLLRQLGVLS